MPKKPFPRSEWKSVEWGCMPLTLRTRTLFASLFAYHCRRPLIAGRRKTIFGRYASFSIRHAERSPLAQLLKECAITDEVSKIEVLVKEGEDPEIDDTDLEAVIRSVREEQDTLFILVYPGAVPEDDYPRLFRAFTRHLVIILPLGKKELSRMERWIVKGNFNACLVYLAIIADRITTGPAPLPDKYASREEWQREANAARLNHLTDLKGPQLRTLIKKLSFLLSFERSGMEISEACEHAHISRKTFYLWNAKDPVFKKLLNIRNT